MTQIATDAGTPRLFPVSDGELIVLMREASLYEPLKLAFGTGGCALQWEPQTPIPWYIERLAQLRGVFGEFIDGGGI